LAGSLERPVRRRLFPCHPDRRPEGPLGRKVEQRGDGEHRRRSLHSAEDHGGPTGPVDTRRLKTCEQIADRGDSSCTSSIGGSGRRFRGGASLRWPALPLIKGDCQKGLSYPQTCVHDCHSRSPSEGADHLKLPPDDSIGPLTTQAFRASGSRGLRVSHTTPPYFVLTSYLVMYFWASRVFVGHIAISYVAVYGA